MARKFICFSCSEKIKSPAAWEKTPGQRMAYSSHKIVTEEELSLHEGHDIRRAREQGGALPED